MRQVGIPAVFLDTSTQTSPIQVFDKLFLRIEKLGGFYYIAFAKTWRIRFCPMKNYSIRRFSATRYRSAGRSEERMATHS